MPEHTETKKEWIARRMRIAEGIIPEDLFGDEVTSRRFRKLVETALDRLYNEKYGKDASV